MILNTLLLALREIRRNLMRSFLTVLGIVIGVAAVITMVTLGNAATMAVRDQISSLGSNLLMVRPGQRMGPGLPSGAGVPFFKETDIEAIASSLGGIRVVAGEARASAVVVADNHNWSTTVTGITADYITATRWTLAAGRDFDPEELQAGSAVCVIGETLRRELFASQPANQVLGETMRVKKFSCTVVGVLASKGQGAMGNDQDDVVMLPLHTVQRRVLGNTRVATLLVSLNDDTDPTRVKEALGQLMRERRKLAEADDDNFNVLDTQQIADTLSGTTRIMTTLLGAVAAVSLLVGGIGIMNIMLVSVTERTREIGVRLAIGALEREVLMQFLVEAVVLASFGGLLGVAIATGATFGLGALMHLKVAFDTQINLLSFGFSAAIGVVFGFVPARRAARLNPIDALRHE